MFSIVGENLTQRLRRMVFGALLRQEVAWYDLQDNRVGVLTSRLAADATMVRGVSGHCPLDKFETNWVIVYNYLYRYISLYSYFYPEIIYIYNT